MKINVLCIMIFSSFIGILDWYNYWYDTSRFKTWVFWTSCWRLPTSWIIPINELKERTMIKSTVENGIYLFPIAVLNRLIGDRRCYRTKCSDQWRRHASRSRKDNTSRLIVPLSITSTRRVANRHRYNTANYRIRVSFTIEGSLAVIR